MTSLSLRNINNTSAVPFFKGNEPKQQQQPAVNYNQPPDTYESKQNNHKVLKSMIKISEYTSGAVSGTIKGGMAAGIIYAGAAAWNRIIKKDDPTAQVKNHGYVAMGVGAVIFLAKMIGAHMHASERILAIDNSKK